MKGKGRTKKKNQLNRILNFFFAFAFLSDMHIELQAEQGGKIGITLLAMWFKSATENPEDIAAARRIVDFHLGWLV